MMLALRSGRFVCQLTTIFFPRRTALRPRRRGSRGTRSLAVTASGSNVGRLSGNSRVALVADSGRLREVGGKHRIRRERVNDRAFARCPSELPKASWC